MILRLIITTTKMFHHIIVYVTVDDWKRIFWLDPPTFLCISCWNQPKRKRPRWYGFARTELLSIEDWPRGVPSCSWVQISQWKRSSQGTTKHAWYVSEYGSRGFVLIRFRAVEWRLLHLLRKDAGGLSYNKGGTLFSDVRYIIVSYSWRSDPGLSHVAIPRQKKGGLSYGLEYEENSSAH